MSFSKSILARSLRRCVLAFATAGFGMTLANCNPVGRGDLVVEWRIEDEKDESLCEDNEVEELRIELYDASDSFYTSAEADCKDFSTTITDIPEGDYSVTALFLDGDGNDASETLDDDVTVKTNQEVKVRFSFDDNSFDNVVQKGNLLIGWTLEGQSPQSMCSSFGVGYVWLQLYDSDGDAYDDSIYADCVDAEYLFEDLPEGDYTVRARLVDTESSPLTNARETPILEVEGNNTTSEQFDFTAYDFLG